MRKSVLAIVSLVIMVACNLGLEGESRSLPFYNSHEFTPEWIQKSDSNYSSMHSIPAFELWNQNGKKITGQDFKGKIYIANFFFTTCPDLCPKLNTNMKHLQTEVPKEVLLVSHSVMPLHDTVKVLKQYAGKMGVQDQKWHLLTGTKQAVYQLARTGYFADDDFAKTKNENTFIHTENLYLVDRKGRIRGVYNGTLKVEIEALLKHIDNLIETEG